MSNILSQFEELLTKIIDTRVEEKIASMNLLDGDSVTDLLSQEIRNELESQEVPDTYGVREIVSEEIDNIDWNDRVNESGALDGVVTEDTLESTMDARDGDEYVKRDEFEDALDALSISRG